VATEHPDPSRTGAGPLTRGVGQLATKLCQDHNIDPAALTLLLCFVYPDGYESVGLAHFGHGERDLFDGVRFTGPTREMLEPDRVDLLLELLRRSATLPPEWQVVRPRA